MREEFVELKNEFKKLQYKKFTGFVKETEVNSNISKIRKTPAVLAFLVFIVLEIIFVFFLPWIFYSLLGIFIVYLVALMFSCMVKIKVQNKKLLVKKFIFKKEFEEKDIEKIYLVTSKKEALGGIRAKIKIIYKTKKGSSIYSLDTMFLTYDQVEKFLKTIGVEELTEKEKKGEFDEKNVFIDNSLLEFVDFVFLIPICILVMIDFLL